MPLGKVSKAGHGQWMSGKVKTSSAAVAVPPTLSTAVVATTGATIVLTFVVPTTPLLPASGITGLTVSVDGSNATFTSAMTSSTVITLTMTSVILPGSTVTVSYSAGNITDSVPTSLADFTGTAVTNNSTYYVAAHSLLFNGTTGYVTGTNRTAQNFTTTMTGSIWVKSSATTGSGTLFDKSYPDRPGYWITQASAATAKWAAYFFLNSSTYVAWKSVVTAVDSTWHMITVTWSSGTVKMYVDGVEDSSKQLLNGGGNTSIGADANPLIVGADMFPSAGTPRDFFSGRLSNLSLWDIALSGAQVAALMNAGKPADLSGVSFFGNCKGWYKLGDNDATGANNILDSSGLGYHMTITGGVTVDTDHP